MFRIFSLAEHLPAAHAAERAVAPSAAFADRETPESHLRTAEAGELVRDTLSGMTANHAFILRRRYEDDWTFARIAAELGVGAPAVHAMHARALDRLRLSLDLMGVSSLRDVL